MTHWTEADLAVIAEAACDPTGLDILQRHFGNNIAALGRACETADALRAGRTVAVGDGLTLSRDVPDGPTGRVITHSDNRYLEADLHPNLKPYADENGLVKVSRDFS